MSKPKAQNKTKTIPSAQSLASKNGSVSTFSEDEIRTRAYQIYEYRCSNGNQAEEDWRQAEIELMELLGGK